MNAIPQKVLLGFAVGALAIVTGHQLTILVLGLLGLIQGGAYSMAGVPPWGVPRLINAMFWGGLWGIGLAWLWDLFPREWPGWARGVAYGLVGPTLLGSWLVVAAIKGNALMAGWDPRRMIIGLLINGVGFGLAMGLIYPLLRQYERRLA